ncbi:TetR/AcrR family transcriptional regulator [Flindersiella endophytica]
MQEINRRERKRLQTRQLLINTAFRLFKEQGYDETTITQIAAEADVAKKTFFNHFPAKEDVVFAESLSYYDYAFDVMAEPVPGESAADLLSRTFDRILESYLAHWPMGGDPEVTETYARLVMTVPALQARSLHIMFDMQRKMAEALAKAFPNQLDPISAASAVGALMGAVQAAGMASYELGRSEQDTIADTRRAAEIALRGLRAL